MARTHRCTYPGRAYRSTWGKPGRGKYYKRKYHRAMRRMAKGTGSTRAVAHWASECNWRGL